MFANPTFRNFYSLIKPGVLYGNVVTAVAGFMFASRHGFDPTLFVATILGTTLVISAACVINNVLDQDIDSIMKRTQNRAIVQGKVSPRAATIFGVILGLAGMTMLLAFTNWIVVLIGALGFVDYVWLYGVLGKRRSMHGTLVGSISGAAPILAGYCAAAGQLDLAAVTLFAVLFFWQMPEFYSISIFRRQEYLAAKVPVISVVKGIEHTKKQILVYTVVFVAASLILPLTTPTSTIYLAAMLLSGAYWIYLGIQGLKAQDDVKWARQMFHFSLIMVLLFSGLISIDQFLP